MIRHVEKLGGKAKDPKTFFQQRAFFVIGCILLSIVAFSQDPLAKMVFVPLIWVFLIGVSFAEFYDNKAKNDTIPKNLMWKYTCRNHDLHMTGGREFEFREPSSGYRAPYSKCVVCDANRAAEKK